jgi:hypothetical protein
VGFAVKGGRVFYPGNIRGENGVFVKGIILVILMLCMCCFPREACAVDDAAIFSHKPGIWQIGGKGKVSRWIVIHNLDEAKNTGIFHIEVIGHIKGRPSWDIERVCNHMAITKDALKTSVIRPLKSGAVYPEPFDDAYAKWKKNAEAGRKDICDRSVLECLSTK